MTAKVSKPRAIAKSTPRRMRNQNCRMRNHISPVMLKMREILQADRSGKKAALVLAGLIFQSESNCQKFLNGTRPLNADGLIALLQSEHGDHVHAVLMNAAPHPRWYAERREDLNVFDLSKEVAAQQRRVEEALKRRIGR